MVIDRADTSRGKLGRKDTITTPKEEKVDVEEFVKEMVSIINKRFGSMERDINRLKTDVSSLSAQEITINRMKSDIRSIKSDVSSLKGTSKMKLDKKSLDSLKK